jgi:hypothetical protein
MRNFTLILNPLKKFYKIVPKKVFSKNVTEICTFSTVTHVRQPFFLLKLFLVHFLKTFSTDFKPAWNYAFFDTFYYLVKKIILGQIHTFLNFEAESAKNGAINKIMYEVNVS